jgi:hypothetical protein
LTEADRAEKTVPGEFTSEVMIDAEGLILRTQQEGNVRSQHRFRRSSMIDLRRKVLSSKRSKVLTKRLVNLGS